MPMTKPQADAIAVLVHNLRTEWDTRGIMAALAKCAHQPAADVALASIRAAMDPGAKTPGVIPTDGPHWAERLAPREAPRPPRHDEQCPHHAGNYREGCHGCAADQKAGTDSPSRPMEQRRVTVLAGQVRQALRTATASKCSHGIVPPAVCNEPHDQPAEETT